MDKKLIIAGVALTVVGAGVAFYYYYFYYAPEQMIKKFESQCPSGMWIIMVKNNASQTATVTTSIPSSSSAVSNVREGPILKPFQWALMCVQPNATITVTYPSGSFSVTVPEDKVEITLHGASQNTTIKKFSY